MRPSLSKVAHRLVSLAVICAVALALTLAETTLPANAIVQPMYTLPFHGPVNITCPVGPYANCPGPGPTTGTNLGTDYSVGQPPGTPVVGDPVLAAAPGVAKYCGEDPFAGHYVVMDHGNGHRSRYLHLNQAGFPSPAGEWWVRGQTWLRRNQRRGPRTPRFRHTSKRHGVRVRHRRLRRNLRRSV